MIIPDSGHLALVLLLAAVIDIVFGGEPPAAVHPVVWIGKLISFLKNAAPKTTENLRYCNGSLLRFICVIARVFSPLHCSPPPRNSGFLALLIEAYFLKATFAINCLLSPPARRFINTLRKTGWKK